MKVNIVQKILLVCAIIATIIVLATNFGAFKIEVIVLLAISIFIYIGFIIFIDYTEEIREDHDNLYKDVNKVKMRMDDIEKKNEEKGNQ